MSKAKKGEEMDKIAQVERAIRHPFADRKDLTSKERKAATLACWGLQWKEIAEVMNTSPEMANYYLRQAGLKLGLSKRKGEFIQHVLHRIEEILRE